MPQDTAQIDAEVLDQNHGGHEAATNSGRVEDADMVDVATVTAPRSEDDASVREIERMVEDGAEDDNYSVSNSMTEDWDVGSSGEQSAL